MTPVCHEGIDFTVEIDEDTMQDGDVFYYDF